jgi:hypothetical protein
VNQQTSRNQRKWGSAATSAGPGKSTSSNRRSGDRDRDRERGDHDTSSSASSSKRTLTDFRIEGLGIPELEWEWRAARIEDEMKRVAGELDRQVEEKKQQKEQQEGEGDEKAAGEEEEEHDDTAAAAGGEEDEVVNMSIELAAPAPPPTSTTDVPALVAGKHRREDDEDDDDDGEGAESTALTAVGSGSGSGDVDGNGVTSVQQSTERERKNHSDHANKHKKVRVGDVEIDPTPEMVVVVAAAAVQPEGLLESVGEAAEVVEAAASEATADDSAGLNSATEAGPTSAEEGDAKPEEESAAQDEDDERDEREPDEEEEEEEEEDVDGAPIDISADSESVFGFDETGATSSPAKKDRDVPAAAPPPPPRENSRLRIYFSTPVSSRSSYTVPGSAAAQDKSTHSQEKEKDRRESTAPTEVAALTSSAIKEEEEETGDADGQEEPAPTPAEQPPKEEALSEAVPPAEIDLKLEKETQPDEPTVATTETKEIKAETENPAAPKEPTGSDAEVLPNASSIEPEAAPEVATEAPAESTDAADAPAADAVNDNVDGEPVVKEETRQPSPAPSAAPSAVETVSAPLPPEPAADRISISYARNTRRMVLDADVVEAVKIYRGEGRIELVVNCKPAIYGDAENPLDDEFRVCKGVLVRVASPIRSCVRGDRADESLNAQLESLDVEADQYIVVGRNGLARAWATHAEQPNETSEHDNLLPPLHRLLVDLDVQDPRAIAFTSDSFTVAAHLDRVNPLTEARWVKTGEVDQYILSLGISNGVDPKDSSKLSEWRNKIRIVDPDPVSRPSQGTCTDDLPSDENSSLQPPTIQDTLDSWATSSNIGSLAERQKFVQTHMSDIDNGKSFALCFGRQYEAAWRPLGPGRGSGCAAADGGKRFPEAD